MPKKLRSALGLLQQTAADWMADNAPRLGASLAYYTVFAISPLTVIVVGMAGLWFGQEAASRQIFEQVGGLVGPQSAEAIRTFLAQAHQPATGTFATSIAVITLLVAATGVFVELQDVLNTIWGVKPKVSSSVLNFIWTRVLSFAMILGIGFLLLVSLIVSAALAALGKYLATYAADVQVLWQSVNMLVSFGVVTVLFALIFKVLPDVRIAWRDVWIGAVITAFLFTIGKLLLGLYLGRSSFASAYGAAGSVVVILVWVHYSAQILFFGAEFTQVYATCRKQNLDPVPFAEPIKVEDKIPAALKRRGEIHSEVEEVLQCPVPAPLRRRQAALGRRPTRDWKFAVPLAALLAWFWFRDRK